jgi:crotonobetainyl-CoA:carnitine CoA-transferase CaiB-like acyl-CoA transferase
MLQGLRVIDHGAFITGPMAAMLLADLGAEVIKVERPDGGDPFRSFEGGLYGPQFRAFNRNKASLVLDLSDAADRRRMDRLVRQADVFIQNSRPGVAERLGTDAARLMALNPRLVHCAITGFGPDGPDAGRAAYDTVAQAVSGYLGLFVAPGDTAIKGPAVADVVTGLYAAQGILAALVARGIDGRGRRVEIAMMNAMAHFASEPFQHCFARGAPPGPVHRSEISQSFAFACADRRLLAIHLSSPEKFWRGLLRALDAPDLGADPRFATRHDRIARYAELEAELARRFARLPCADWCDRLLAEDVPHAEVARLDTVLEGAQARHLCIEAQARHPTEGPYRGIASPLLFDGARGAPVTAPPRLDEQGPALRAWLDALPD